MLDIRLIRQNPDAVRTNLQRRGFPMTVDDILRLDADLRRLQTEVDTLRQQRNQMSETIGSLKKRGQEVGVMPQEVKLIAERIKAREEQMGVLEEQRQDLLLGLPNLLDASVPDGPDETGNVEVRRWGKPPDFAFTPRPHWEIGESLGILDTERAVKLAKTRFVMLRREGAHLERALINFMLDLHTTEHGYTEVWPPAIVNAATMTANGNLPKFGEDLFQVGSPSDLSAFYAEGSPKAKAVFKSLAGVPELYLIPTAEVPLTQMHRDEILSVEDLPIPMTAFTPCFRSEAGSAGKDTRGMLRVHQFSKVELVKVVSPDTSFADLENMVGHAEKVLQLLDLPYRVVLLCSGDTTGFSSAKTYDLEVWFPAQERYREISSVSNCTDFQARRGNLRFRPAPDAKLEYPHTLNGSGVAVGRTLAAILENFQQADGSVVIPPVLRPYMRGLERITV